LTISRLPYPRGPGPLKITLPSAAALTGSPALPAIEMPMLRGSANPWITRPLAGQSKPVALAPRVSALSDLSPLASDLDSSPSGRAAAETLTTWHRSAPLPV
jgi:hypothetical protein